MQESILSKIDKERLPKHIAIIMDGNGRWAEARSFPRLEGHRVGAGVSVEIVKRMFQLNVSHQFL